MAPGQGAGRRLRPACGCRFRTYAGQGAGMDLPVSDKFPVSARGMAARGGWRGGARQRRPWPAGARDVGAGRSDAAVKERRSEHNRNMRAVPAKSACGDRALARAGGFPCPGAALPRHRFPEDTWDRTSMRPVLAFRAAMPSLDAAARSNREEAWRWCERQDKHHPAGPRDCLVQRGDASGPSASIRAAPAPATTAAPGVTPLATSAPPSRRASGRCASTVAHHRRSPIAASPATA
jgi:hypothetical protein